MAERYSRFHMPESPELVVPEKKQLTNEDVIKMFGTDYKKLVQGKATQLGMSEQLRFFDSPLPHNGSQAVYLAEQFVGDHLILVSVLGPNMRTSRHYHEAPMVQERYFHIAGESFVNVDGKELPLNHEQNLIKVSLGVVHQARTQGNPALTLIIMENARLVSSGRLHIKDI